jgi:hypothetical protein
MIYVNGVRLWLQVSRQRSIKICSYPCHFALSSSRAKAINEMPIRSQEVVAKQAPKGRERIHGDLSGEAIEEQGCSRGSLHPARLAIVGGKRETVHWPSTTPSRAASTLGPWPSGVFYYLLFVCVQRWREQLDRKAAAAALPVKGRGREGRGGRQIQALVSAAERSNCTDVRSTSCPGIGFTPREKFCAALLDLWRRTMKSASCIAFGPLGRGFAKSFLAAATLERQRL